MIDNNDFNEWIPKYLNNQLEKEQKAAFEKRLLTDPALKEELEEYSFIKQSYSDVKEKIPEPSPDLFSKIMNNIEASEQENRSTKQESDFDLGLNKLIDFIKDYLFAPKMGWSLAGAQLAIILFLVFSAPAPQNTTFTTLSDKTTDPDSGTQINVVFKDEAIQKNVQKLLNDIDASIINGPSENGIYILLVDPEIADEKKKEEKDAVIILKESDIVKFAQKKL